MPNTMTFEVWVEPLNCLGEQIGDTIWMEGEDGEALVAKIAKELASKLELLGHVVLAAPASEGRDNYWLAVVE